jgi:multidrug transporter EmrE-like cation transporter
MKTTLLVVAMITCTVVANLLLKLGAAAGAAAGAAWWALNWRIAAGFASFGAALLIYTVVLRTLPLNVAQSFTSAQFIGTIVASALVLSEPITGIRWVGIALIAAGIAVVGWSSS